MGKKSQQRQEEKKRFKHRNQKTPTKLARPIIFGGGALLVAVIAIFIIFGGGGSPAADASPYDFVGVPAPISGSAAAPITITVYEDFNCHACAHLSQVVMSEIEENFVDPGNAQIEFRHFVHYGAGSQRAAEAAECVNEQDVAKGTHYFRPYHDTLFANQNETFTTELLETFARRIGVQDLVALVNCIESGRYERKVKQSTSFIRSQGANGTPTIMIGDEMYVGIPGMTTFRAVIRKQLNQ
jgi:protein-disulfide isomerase